MVSGMGPFRVDASGKKVEVQGTVRRGVGVRVFELGWSTCRVSCVGLAVCFRCVSVLGGQAGGGFKRVDGPSWKGDEVKFGGCFL